MTAPIDVAVGVVIRDDGSFLLAQRPDGKPMAGYWEFAGGKLEAGESVFAALVREFEEELGLAILTARPWAQRVVVYPHATVCLHYWRSIGEGRGWSGVPRANEGQDFRWERIERLTTEPWLDGALPVKRWLQLPARYAISNASSLGVDAFLVALEERLADGIVRLLQLREPALDPSTFSRLFDAVLARCRAHGAKLLVNSRHDASYWSRADGVHLTARDLMRLAARPAADWCVASCHVAGELRRAGELALDAATLGPVKATASHPGATGLGWNGFRERIEKTPLPVYALGGLDESDLPDAVAAGAHGVAMIRGAWGRHAATVQNRWRNSQ